MKKVIKCIPTLIQILLVIGAFVINHFTQTRMGMMRHVMFTNRKWQSQFHALTIKNISVVILGTALLIAIIYMLYKRRNYIYDMSTKFFIIVSLVLIIGTLTFMTVFSIESILAYYYVSIMLYMASLIQVIRLHVFLQRNKKHKFLFR